MTSGISGISAQTYVELHLYKSYEHKTLLSDQKAELWEWRNNEGTNTKGKNSRRRHNEKLTTSGCGKVRKGKGKGLPWGKGLKGKCNALIKAKGLETKLAKAK